MTFPQVWQIWYFQETAGLSLFTWSFYSFNVSLWLLYGFVHRDLALIVTNSLWLFVDFLVVIDFLIF